MTPCSEHERNTMTRRFFLKVASVWTLLLAFFNISCENQSSMISDQSIKRPTDQLNKPGEAVSDIYVAKNGTPQQNVSKIIEMMGGIEKFIGLNDIVVLKPNAQWWNQGRTNLAAMKGFMDLVLNIPDFKGEIIIAENQHFVDNSLPEDEKDNVRGWTQLSEINGDIDGINHSLNTLIDIYQNHGHENVTKYHWRDGGPRPEGRKSYAGDGGIGQHRWVQSFAWPRRLVGQ